MKELTKKQDEVLQFIKKFIVENNYPPTTREIGKELGISSPATIHVHLSKLIQKGYIKKQSLKNRSIELLVENEYENKKIVKVPLLNKNIKDPISELDNPKVFLELPSYLIPEKKEVFTLCVKEKDMINVGILENDIIIAEKTKNVKNGDIIVVLTDDNNFTIKTYFKEDEYYRLQPENDKIEPIVKNVTIIGKIIGLYRKI